MSNFEIEHLEELLSCAKVKPVVNQVSYPLLIMHVWRRMTNMPRFPSTTDHASALWFVVPIALNLSRSIVLIRHPPSLLVWSKQKKLMEFQAKHGIVTEGYSALMSVSVIFDDYSSPFSLPRFSSILRLFILTTTSFFFILELSCLDDSLQ